MPLNSETFPSVNEFCSRILDQMPGLSVDQMEELVGKSLLSFHVDFVDQTCPHNLVKDYCKEVAALLNDRLPQAPKITPLVLWALAQDLLAMGGLKFSPSLPKTTLDVVEQEFYRRAGPGKPVADLVNQVFVGNWH